METTMNLTTELNIDAFVIPNIPGRLNLDFFLGKRYANELERIAELNNLPFDKEKDKMVEVWFTGDVSENLQDHGFKLEIDGYEYHFSAGTILSYLPETFLKGYKEGDIISLIIPLKPIYKYYIPFEEMIGMSISKKERREYTTYFKEGENDEEDLPEAPEFLIKFNIRLNQKDYRYRSFGNFEDVVKRVTR